MITRTRCFAVIGTALIAACSVEPTAPPPAPQNPPAPSLSGALRGSVLVANAADQGMPGVLIGFRSATEHIMVVTDSDGSFIANGLATVEWRAELELPEQHTLAPGETGTRVAVVLAERTLALTPFRVQSPAPVTPPVAAAQAGAAVEGPSAAGTLSRP